MAGEIHFSSCADTDSVPGTFELLLVECVNVEPMDTEG